MPPGALRRVLVGAVPAIVLSAVALLAGGVSASQGVNYCQVIPTITITPEQWAFHGGAPITGARGSYTRGHGDINLSAKTANGVICQVDRSSYTAPDREIVLSIVPKVIYTSHTAMMFGVAGNIMKVHVRVKTSTDAACAVGTTGEVTVFASYNGVHADAVDFSFPAACRDHDHSYTGSSVVTNVPPN
jgi:hypothetical protein